MIFTFILMSRELESLPKSQLAWRLVSCKTRYLYLTSNFERLPPYSPYSKFVLNSGRKYTPLNAYHQSLLVTVLNNLKAKIWHHFLYLKIITQSIHLHLAVGFIRCHMVSSIHLSTYWLTVEIAFFIFYLYKAFLNGVFPYLNLVLAFSLGVLFLEFDYLFVFAPKNALSIRLPCIALATMASALLPAGRGSQKLSLPLPTLANCSRAGRQPSSALWLMPLS